MSAQYYLLKTETDIAPNWLFTLFGSYNTIHEDLNDNNGATPAQVSNYGKDFALQDTNPALATYSAYNHTLKYSDMDYARLQGSVTDSLKVDDTFYTYAYVNKTFTATNIEQTEADILAGKTEGEAHARRRSTAAPQCPPIFPVITS